MKDEGWRIKDEGWRSYLSDLFLNVLEKVRRESSTVNRLLSPLLSVVIDSPLSQVKCLSILFVSNLVRLLYNTLEVKEAVLKYLNPLNDEFSFLGHLLESYLFGRPPFIKQLLYRTYTLCQQLLSNNRSILVVWRLSSEAEGLLNNRWKRPFMPLSLIPLQPPGRDLPNTSYEVFSHTKNATLFHARLCLLSPSSMPTRLHKNRRKRGHVQAGHGRIGKC